MIIYIWIYTHISKHVCIYIYIFLFTDVWRVHKCYIYIYSIYMWANVSMYTGMSGIQNSWSNGCIKWLSGMLKVDFTYYLVFVMKQVTY